MTRQVPDVFTAAQLPPSLALISLVYATRCKQGTTLDSTPEHTNSEPTPPEPLFYRLEAPSDAEAPSTYCFPSSAFSPSNHTMKRLFGAPKSSTRHLPSDDTAPPISHAPEDTWTPLSQPPPSSDSSPHFTPPTGPPPPLAPSPTPHSSPPTTGGAPARRPLFSFGRKENPVEESQQQQGGGEQQYNHASAGWSGGNMMIAAQPSAPRPVGPPRVNNVAGVIGELSLLR